MNSRWHKKPRKRKVSENQAAKCSKAELNTYDQFFRGEHPDKRTGAEFLRDMGFKMAEKKRSSLLWYPIKSTAGRNGMEIKCVQNGHTYGSMRHAARELGINHTNLSKHLKGDKAYSHCGGYNFVFV